MLIRVLFQAADGEASKRGRYYFKYSISARFLSLSLLMKGLAERFQDLLP